MRGVGLAGTKEKGDMTQVRRLCVRARVRACVRARLARKGLVQVLVGVGVRLC